MNKFETVVNQNFRLTEFFCDMIWQWLELEKAGFSITH